MRVIAALIVPPVIWFSLVLLFLFGPLPAPPFGDRNKLAAVLTGFFGIAYLLFVLAVIYRELDASAASLDQAAQPLGLRSGPHLPGFRSYQGEIDGRRVTLSYIPSAALQRSALDATAAAKPPARLSAGWTTPLTGCAGCPRVPVDGGGPLSGLVVLSDDPAWAAGLLARPRVTALLADLLADPDALGSRFVHLEPGSARLQARPTATGLGSAAKWLASLVSLAEECERPAPTPN